MSAKKSAAKRPARKAAAKPPATVPLPPVGIARFKEITVLLEQLLREKTGVFLDGMSNYQDRKRAATDRPLNHVEAAQIAAAMAEQADEDPLDFAAKVQASDLRSHDPVGQLELLAAAGLSTVPELVDVAMNFVALVEMPTDDFTAALRDGTVRSSVAEAAAAALAGDPPLTEVRSRAAAALAHVAGALGENPAALVGLLQGLVGDALKTAIDQALPTREEAPA